ncbi:hypothetical protein AYL99_11648 [Fonsecaea erecta]|uniref:Uncharacterized protein n=1 Tax=Fonsecaea erecta TaxID=1367422 RepID=A0A178Z4J5_9EURO|nr:hypothetical protein AYL99_11648 [Fonsecaea erecta]OAP54113.1 hypothetical protein AYL99_11648 [Fonsecaea erecta]
MSLTSTSEVDTELDVVVGFDKRVAWAFQEQPSQLVIARPNSPATTTEDVLDEFKKFDLLLYSGMRFEPDLAARK